MLAVIAVACCVVFPMLVIAVAGFAGVFGDDKRNAVLERAASLQRRIWNSYRRG